MAMNLGEASARITLDISDLAGKSAQAQGILSDMDGAVGKSTSGFGKFQNALMGFGAAMIPAVGVGLSMAIDLEQAMANVNATLGGLDTSVLSELEQGFMDIGAASQFSAIEVAAVGDEIARAGFATEDIVDMTRSVVELSQATGTDLMTSVSGITSVMQIWSPAIVDTEIALTDAARAADIFTVAANASSADVQDIIAGMRNFGPTAASIGIGFDEASGAIAYFTNYGLKAANAGVSMTRAIQNLQDPTAEAAELMQELGISVFDMEGNFVGLPTLFDQLQVAMKDMTPEARNMALTTLFGAEAIDVMTVAAMTGGDPLRMILGLMEETGVAAEQSALRMDTLKAQFGELVESVTNLLGRMMSGLIPALRLFVDVANMVVNVLSRIPQPILAAIGAVMGLAAAFATLRGAAAGLQILSRLTGVAVPGGALFGGLATGLLAVAAAAGVAYAAIRFNLFGIRDAVDAFRIQWEGMIQMRDPVSAFFSALGAALRSFDVGILDTIGQKFEDVGNKIDGFLDGFRDAWDFVFGDGPTRNAEKNGKKQTAAANLLASGFGNLRDNVSDANDPLSVLPGFMRRLLRPLDNVNDGIVEMSDGTGGAAVNTRELERTLARARYPMTTFGAALAVVGEAFRRVDMPRLAAAFDTMGWAVDIATGAFREFREQGAGPVTSVLLALGVAIPPLETAMAGLSAVTSNLGDLFLAAVRGDWSQAFLDLREAAAGAWVVMQELGSAVATVAVNIGNWVMGQIPDIWSWLQDTAIPALGAGAVWLWNALVNIGSWAKGIVSDIWPYVTQWASDAMSGVATAAGTLWGVIVNIGSWAKGIVSDLWPYVTMWASDALSGITSAAGTLWGVIVNIGSWAKGIVSDLAPYVAMWASEAVAGVTEAAATLWGVLVNIGSWAKGIVSDVWPYIKMWASAALDGISGAAATLWGVTLDIGSWAKGQMPDLGAAIQDWAEGEYNDAVAGGRAPKIETVEVDVGSVEVKSDGASAEQANAEGRMFGFALADNVIQGIQTGWDWVFGGGGGAGGGAGGGPGGSGGGLAGFIANIGRGFDIVASSISGAFQGGIDAIIADLESGDGLSSRLGDAFMDMFDFSHASWMGTSVQNLVRPFDEFFRDVGRGLKRAWEGFTDFLDDVFSGDVDLPDLSINWPDMPEPPDWMTTAPQWWTNIKEGRLPWDDGGAGSLSDAANDLEDSLTRIAGLMTGNRLWQIGQDLGGRGGGGAGGGWELPALSSDNLVTSLGQAEEDVRNGLSNVGTTATAALTEGLATVGPTVSTAMLGAQIAMQTSMSTIGAAIGTQAASWGTNLATGLQSLTTTSTTAFLGMQLGIATSMATIGSTITTQASSWGTALSAGMTTMTASATTSMATIGTVVQAGMTIATAAVRAGGSAMSSAMASAGAAMASAAATAAAQTASVLVTGMALATAAVRNAASQWPGIIAAAGGAMYSAGYSVGAAAGQGVVAGLLSMLGAVQAAANAIVSTAMGAMAAAAAIASPSKVTTGYGQMMGQGLIVGMRQMQPAVARQSASLMAMAAPTPYTPSAGAMGGNVSNTTTVIQVDTHIAGNIIGNDDFADEMADRTAWKIASVKQRRDLAKGVAW